MLKIFVSNFTQKVHLSTARVLVLFCMDSTRHSRRTGTTWPSRMHNMCGFCERKPRNSNTTGSKTLFRGNRCSDGCHFWRRWLFANVLDSLSAWRRLFENAKITIDASLQWEAWTARSWSNASTTSKPFAAFSSDCRIVETCRLLNCSSSSVEFLLKSCEQLFGWECLDFPTDQRKWDRRGTSRNGCFSIWICVTGS